MSHLINVADEVYEELTTIKKMRDASYSEVIQSLLHKHAEEEKVLNWGDILKWIKERDKKYKGKKERINHDLIAYGVSRDSS